MTLQEAKDKTANEYGFHSWADVDVTLVSMEGIMDDVANRYAENKWYEACETVNKMQAGGVYQQKPEFNP